VHRRAQPLTVDVATPSSVRRAVADGDVVVNCTGRDDPRLGQVAIDAAAHYVDISATSSHLDQLGALHDTAVTRDSTVLLSVGLAPGLTNLLAADVHRRETDDRPIDITVLLGLGDDYGAAARGWSLGRVATTFVDPVDGRVIGNFSGGSRVALPGGFGTRRAYRFDLADQYTLTRDLARPVRSRIAFDPATATILAALASGVPPLGRLAARLTNRLPALRLGTSWWAVRVERQGGPAHWAIGDGQSDATAAVTAVAVDAVMGGGVPPGAHHLHQVLTLADARQQLQEAGVHTSRPLSRSGGTL
jgi:hypothetical protein